MMAMPAGMAELLDRKYAVLQQQADATTMNAQSQRTAVNAAANLDSVRAKLMPAESEAGIAETLSKAALNKETTKYLGPETLARIGKLKAETLGINTDTKINARMGLQDRSIGSDSITDMLRGRLLGAGLSGFSF